MSGGETPAPKRPWAPRWVWALALAMSLLQPAAFLLIRYAPPEGMTATGMHLPDSALFIQAMSMFETGFFSPYATILAPDGLQNPAYFAIPHLWFYGIQGAIAQTFGLDFFLFYGFCNGAGTLILLLAMYRFFYTATPHLAGLSFLLFTLGGGIGGVAYLVSVALGLHTAAGFEEVFWRFAVYELIEGAHLFPVTYLGRSYYTISMAACFGALTVFIHALRMRCGAHGMFAGIILFAGAFLNARFGLFTLAIAVCYVTNRTMRGHTVPPAIGAPLILGGAAGWLCSWALMMTSPVMVQNHVDVGNMNMYLSPFVTTALWLLPLALADAVYRVREMPLGPRTLGGAGLGYLTAFAFLFIVYQTYYGNWFVARDSAVAIAISDWALIGAAAGAFFAYRLRGVRQPSAHAWITIWMLGFLALSISAFGQGWFLRFGPQRLMVLLCPALVIAAASTLRRLAVTRPRLAVGYAGFVCGCGIVSIAVSTFWFQAPVGRRPEPQPFDETHTSVVTHADAELMDAIPANEEGLGWIPAVVIAPLPASDAVVFRRGNSVAFGIGSFNMSDQPYLPLRELNELFFSDRLEDGTRISILHTLRIHYVYCPDTWPVTADTRAALDACAYLIPVAEAGQGVLYKVEYSIVEPMRALTGAFQASSAEELLANVRRDLEVSGS